MTHFFILSFGHIARDTSVAKRQHMAANGIDWTGGWNSFARKLCETRGRRKVDFLFRRKSEMALNGL
jgi:hypothetical protein